MAPEDRQRIDKWLWAARFFKSRSLAAEAVGSGQVRLNGHVAKPARDVRIGDTLDIRTPQTEWQVVVLGLNGQRRPAAEAQQLYRETESGRSRREKAAELRRLAPTPGADLKGRPTKKARRLIGKLF